MICCGSANVLSRIALICGPRPDRPSGRIIHDAAALALLQVSGVEPQGRMVRIRFPPAASQERTVRLSRPVCDADLRGGRTAHFGDDPLDGGQVWSSPNAKP